LRYRKSSVKSKVYSSEYLHLKEREREREEGAGCQWLMPVILATQKVEIMSTEHHSLKSALAKSS
jgi:hypothetical protein